MLIADSDIAWLKSLHLELPTTRLKCGSYEVAIRQSSSNVSFTEHNPICLLF